MISCKEVATLLSTDQVASQSIWQRLAVRTHLMVCRHCRRFARQIALMKRGAAALGAVFDAEIGPDFTHRMHEKLKP